ncbi:MAG TPA: DUF364 domain-containing protein [Anaeromyxobacteraceae bacterium]|nr:DUF364 domain-containing protein [Anaeromyxobacteraceae bacterium]
MGEPRDARLTAEALDLTTTAGAPGKRAVIDALVEHLLGESPLEGRVEDVWVFHHWVAVRALRWSLARIPAANGSTLRPGNTNLASLVGRRVGEVARELWRSDEPVHRAAGAACLNAAIPLATPLADGNAMGCFARRARRMKSCFIGHFEHAAAWRDAGFPVTIVELEPRPGDIHWREAGPALEQAELVFITGLTLLNDTFDDVVYRTPNALIRVLMGPSVPCTPALFDHGIHVIGAMLVEDPSGLIEYLRRGGTSSREMTPKHLIRQVNWASHPTFLQDS